MILSVCLIFASSIVLSHPDYHPLKLSSYGAPRGIGSLSGPCEQSQDLAKFNLLTQNSRIPRRRHASRISLRAAENLFKEFVGVDEPNQAVGSDLS